MVSDKKSKSSTPPKSGAKIVRVKTQVARDEFELILPGKLAETLQADTAAPGLALLANAPAPSADFRPISPENLQRMAEKRPEDHRIMVVENAVDRETCRMLCEFARNQQRTRSGLVNYDQKKDEMLQSTINTEQRDTFNVSTEEIRATILRGLFYRLITKHIEPFFNLTIEWWEEPQLLYYTNGGKYDPHFDADYWVTNPDGTTGWKRIHDRDISILLYLNDEFTGGALNFPDYNIQIQPKPGLLCAFPSTNQYKHGAMPTLSGERYVLVTWSSQLGVPKVRPQPPRYPVIYRKDFDTKTS